MFFFQFFILSQDKQTVKSALPSVGPFSRPLRTPRRDQGLQKPSQKRWIAFLLAPGCFAWRLVIGLSTHTKAGGLRLRHIPEGGVVRCVGEAKPNQCSAEPPRELPRFNRCVGWLLTVGSPTLPPLCDSGRQGFAALNHPCWVRHVGGWTPVLGPAGRLHLHSSVARPWKPGWF